MQFAIAQVVKRHHDSNTLELLQLDKQSKKIADEPVTLSTKELTTNFTEVAPPTDLASDILAKCANLGPNCEVVCHNGDLFFSAEETI